MTVSVAGRPIRFATMLSALGQLSLAFVDGGLQWLQWAISAQVARYDFPDETTLVGEVQQGLHASRFALLPQLGLQVSPVKLMTLGLADLRLLARAEGGDEGDVVAAQVARILADNDLVAAGDLAVGVALLGELGVASTPLFQAPTFEERLALRKLAGEAPPEESTPALQQEAAAFAVQQARTPLEFCDYYRVYLDRSAGLEGAAPAARAQAAGGALQALLPLLFGALDCPQVGGLPSPGEVQAAVDNWLARGRQVGFARLSLGVHQIVRHTRYQGETGEAAGRIVQLYLQSAQAFLAANRPAQGRLGQDGASGQFPIRAGSLCASLQVDATGVISLGEFGAAPSPSTLPAPATDTGSHPEEEPS